MQNPGENTVYYDVPDDISQKVMYLDQFFFSIIIILLCLPHSIIKFQVDLIGKFQEQVNQSCLWFEASWKGLIFTVAGIY